MPGVYGVTPDEVSAELPALFPDGFADDTVPSRDQVTSFITTADTIVALRIEDVTGEPPTAADRGAVLARRYIIEATKGHVLRIVYLGNDAVRVDEAAKPYEKSAADLLASIDLLASEVALIVSNPGGASNVSKATAVRW